MLSCNKEVNVLEHADGLKKNSKRRRNRCKDRDKEFAMVQEIPYFIFVIYYANSDQVELALMIEVENNQ